MSTRVVGDVAVRVGADVGPLGIGLQRGARQVETFGNRTSRAGQRLMRRMRNLATAAAAMGAAVAAASRQAIQSLDRIGKQADRLGVTTDELQQLRFAAEQSGVQINQLETGIQRFTRRVAEAAQGTGSARAALEEMGIQLTDADGNIRATTDLLADVSDAMANTSSQADRIRLAFALFDSEGVGMVNMLRDGSDAFREALASAEEFGAVVEESAIRSAEALQNELGNLGAGIRAQLSEALVEAGPLLIAVAEQALRLARALNGLVEFIGRTHDALSAAGDPAEALAQAHDEVVAAMADEIRQSQALDAALQAGGAMSQQMAETKLAEANARLQNAQAAIAEQRAIAQGSLAMTRAVETIQNETERLDAIRPPSGERDDVPARLRDSFDQAEARLAQAIQQRRDLLQVDQELIEHEAQVMENISRLEEAIANGVGGVVRVGGDVIEPIDPRESGDGGGGGGGGSSRPESADASVLEELLGIDPVTMERTSGLMDNAIAQQQEFMERAREAMNAAREQGLIDQDQYNQLEQELQAEHNRTMQNLRLEQASEALGATSQMFESLAQAAGTGGERLLRVSKILSAAQAFVSTLAGAAEALRLPFPANLAAAAQIVATGAGFVAAIKGAQPGGANDPRAAAGSAATNAGAVLGSAEDAARDITRTINVNLRGGLAGQAAGIRDIIGSINEELDDGANLNVNVV